MSELIISNEPCNPEEIPEIEAVLQKNSLAPQFWRNKYVKESRKNWDQFYKRNKTNFFKDRHYLDREFPQILESSNSPHPTRLLEIGCGVGNAIFPLIEEFPHIYGYAIDFSSKAIELVKSHPLYSESKISAHVCDITSEELPQSVRDNPPQLAMMLFVLSAIHPSKFLETIDRIYKCLEPGGTLFFRDYGRYDLAQLRLPKGSKIDENFYVRCDGTAAYFFELGELKGIFETVGFICIDAHYHRKKIRNRKENLEMKRVWLQGLFQKPRV